MSELRIHLRDLNPTMVDAWRREFASVDSVRVSCGDIFCEADGPLSDTAPIDVEADAVVSPANSFGFMDGGIDAVYTAVLGPQVQRNLQALIEHDLRGELPVGQAAIVATGNASIPWCVSAPTMRVPADVADSVNAFLAFRAALWAVVDHNGRSDVEAIETLLCPGLGTAIGRMPAARCARQMRAAWDDVFGDGPEFPGHLAHACEFDMFLRQ